jgi:hypothetical protein
MINHCAVPLHFDGLKSLEGIKVMAAKKPDVAPSWTVPWNPIYTPFSLKELVALLAPEVNCEDINLHRTVCASWQHPEDPLNRIQRYNFWDILQQSLTFRLVHSTVPANLRSALIEEYLNHIAQFSGEAPIDSSLAETGGSNRIHSVLIYQHIKGMGGDTLATFDDFASPSRGTQSSCADALEQLIEGTIELMLRIESMFLSGQSLSKCV